MNDPKVVDHYAVLGVPRDATADQIRSEWLKRQPLYHPDSYTLWQINAAADVLLDAARRAEFDESLRKADPRSPDVGPDSLDFSDAGPPSPVPPPSPGADAHAAGARASGSESAAVVRPRRTVRSERDSAGGARKVAVPVLIIVAIGVVAFAMTERSSKESVKPAPSGKAPSPAQTSPAYKPPQTATPSAKPRTPPAQAPAPPAQQPQNVRTSAVPADFLPAFQEYTKRSGGKAIALALDNDGRWAYGTVSGFAVQSDANEEAMSECARNKAQSGIHANCRVFAVGDKVVW